MKKLLLSMLALICTGSLFAQINKTYSLSGYNIHPEAIAKIPATGGGIYFSGFVSYNGGQSDSLLVTKLNPGGGFMTARMYNFKTAMQAMTNTADNGLLVAVVGSANGNTWGLHLLKYDMNLNLLWARVLPVATFYDVNAGIDIEKVTNSAGNEEYYVLFSDSPVPTTNNGVYTFSVAKISGTGGLLWREQYLGSPGCTTVSCGWDCSSSLTSYNAPSGAKRIVISGTRRRLDTGGEHDDLFYMTIADNGNIVKPYTVVTTYAQNELSEPDVMWDGQNLVTTYLQEGVPGTNAASVIGLIKMDTNFTLSAGKVYWNSCENYGTSITTAPDGNYVIGGRVGPCTSPTETTNPYFLKLNRTTLTPMYFNRYNINREMQGTMARHFTDAQGLNYTVYSIGITAPNFDARVLVTNAAGISCGAVSYNINTMSFTPTAAAMTYTHGPRQMNGLTLTPMGVTLAQTDCNSSSKPDSYRMLGTAGTDNAMITPTLLHSTTEQVQCILNSTTPGTATVVVYSITGQKLYGAQHEITAGENRFTIPAHFTTGMNLVQLSVNGKMLVTEKLTVVE